MEIRTEIDDTIFRLVQAACQNELIREEDRIYIQNRLYHRLGLECRQPLKNEQMSGPDPSFFSTPDLLDKLVEDAVSRGLIEDLSDAREMLSSDLMNLFLDKPSVISDHFEQLYEKDPKTATDWFYKMNQSSNYIQTKQIARNISFRAPSPYGVLEITINLAKPEKNPRDIAAARSKPSTGYPRCQLCIENEGYPGRIGYPARSNHRMIRLKLGGERWYFQYSPYVYYPEHCIVLSHEHRDMHIDRSTICNLLTFVQRFPHYFIGSNADLPIVGGSILTHDHYQGGHYELPMARAMAVMHFPLPSFPDLQASVLKWPMASLRLRGRDAAEIAAASDYILQCWRNYSDESVDIIAKDEQGPHNTMTPIARRRGTDYEMDLVFRNNRQSEEHPLGIFHPHESVHHIKKENIGLIEVMGLAVLPGRLQAELAFVEQFLQGLPVTVPPIHQPWAESLKGLHPGPLSAEEAHEVVRLGLADKFLEVLTDASVFKEDEAGREALRRFLLTIGAKLQE